MKSLYYTVTFLAALMVLAYTGFQTYLHWPLVVQTLHKVMPPPKHAKDGSCCEPKPKCVCGCKCDSKDGKCKCFLNGVKCQVDCKCPSPTMRKAE